MFKSAKKLLLLRHAKSDWDAPFNADFERPLNERGRISAPLIAEYARDNNHIPDLVLCSPALRTRQTLELFLSTLEQDIETKFADELYGASTQEINQLIQSCPNSVSSLLVIGHNPGLGAMAYNLSPEHTEKFGKFPTASFAVFGFEKQEWQGFDYGPCSYLDFVKPRDLT